MIAFASRSLSNTERNYPTHKLEFLALKWAITDRFHEYLYGGQFDVYTDNNPLTYILTLAKLDAMGQRWVASLENYDFRIFYKSGMTNVEADALSCIPRDGHALIDTPTIKAIMTAVPSTDWSEYNLNPSEVVCKSTQIVVHKRTKDDWKIEQEDDPVIGPVIEAMKNKFSNTSGFSDESKRLFRNRSQLLFRCGLLYRKVFDGQLQENKFQFILPKLYGSISLFTMGFPRRSCLIKVRTLKVFSLVNCVNNQIRILRTTPYRPEGNGSCERFNRTLISMLGTLPDDFKSKWPHHISTLVDAYNCTCSNATGFSPYYLLYGRQPLLPIDIEYGVFTPELSEAITYKYVQELKSRLEHAFNKANEFCQKEASRTKE